MGEKESQYTNFLCCSGSERLDLEKGVYRSPYVMCNLRNSNRIALPRLVTNRDLALELLVSQPLRSKKVQNRFATFTEWPEIVLTLIRISVTGF